MKKKSSLFYKKREKKIYNEGSKQANKQKRGTSRATHMYIKFTKRTTKKEFFLDE